MLWTSGYVSGSHMIICGFFSIPAMMATVGNSAAIWMRLVGVHVAEEDVVVGVQLRRHRLEADRRTAGADLDVDAGVDAAGRDERTGDRTPLLVDGVAVADHLVDPAVLGLGVPVGLDDDGLRAVRRQVDIAGRRAAARRAVPSLGGRRSSCRRPSDRPRASPPVPPSWRRRHRRRRRRRRARGRRRGARPASGGIVGSASRFSLSMVHADGCGWSAALAGGLVPPPDDELGRANRRTRTRRCRAATTGSAPP